MRLRLKLSEVIRHNSNARTEHAPRNRFAEFPDLCVGLAYAGATRHRAGAPNVMENYCPVERGRVGAATIKASRPHGRWTKAFGASFFRRPEPLSAGDYAASMLSEI